MADPTTSAIPDFELNEINRLLRFPLKEDPAYSGRIRFQIFEANELQLNTKAKEKEGSIAQAKKKRFDGNNFTKDSVLKFDNELDQEDADFGVQLQNSPIEDASAEAQAIQQSLFEGFTYTRSEDRQPIDLYFPIAMVFNDAIQYNDASIGVLGAAALGAAQNTDSVFGAVQSAIANSFKSLFDFASSDVAEDAGRLALSRLSQRVPSQDLQNAASLALGVSVNPNTRTLFQGVGIRQFTFQFKMIPTSQREAREIEDIIRVFREESYPDVFGSEDIPFGYKFPNVFKISFKHRGQTAKIPKLEYCYLRSVQHVYNPNGGTMHADGRPNEVDITLTFSEIRALNKQDIRRGA